MNKALGGRWLTGALVFIFCNIICWCHAAQPVVDQTGMNMNLTISVDGLELSTVETGEVYMYYGWMDGCIMYVCMYVCICMYICLICMYVMYVCIYVCLYNKFLSFATA